ALVLRWALPGEASVSEAATVGLSLAQLSPRIPSGEHEHHRTRWRAPRRGAPASQGYPSEGYPGEQDPRVDRWPETGYVKKLQRRDNTFYYYNRQRECDDKEVHKVKIYAY
uniref:Uncharacterized protein n=1 Tax=Monodon monoceros TaxID=40151 RepID=A0A8C6BL96_MONMO